MRHGLCSVVFVAVVLAAGLSQAHAAQTNLVVAGPSSVTVNVPFNVDVTLTDSFGNPITTATDRVYLSVNGVGAGNLLLRAGTVRFAGVRATRTPVTITASCPTRSLTKSITIPGTPAGTPPSITSANFANFTVGTASTFTIQTTGVPTPPTITLTAPPGAPYLPPGVTFVNNGNGTATLAGTATSAGTFTLKITATNSAGTASQTFTLTVTGGPSATITSFSPAAAPAGNTLTIYGTNLTGATGVTFTGGAVATPTVISATRIRCTVPAGATTGRITVTGPFGSVQSAGTFTFLNLPAITLLGSVGSMGNIDVGYVVTQPEGASVDLDFEYSTGGPIFSPCSQAPSAATPEPSGVVDVRTSAGGTQHHFLWDSVRDLGSTNNASVRIRARGVVKGQPGAVSNELTFAVNDVGVAPNRGLRGCTVVGPYGGSTFNSVVADFNRDGKPDMVCATSAGVQISFGLGDGTLVSPPTNYSGNFSAAGGICVTDLNGDGWVDLIAIGSGAQGITTFLNDQTGQFNTNDPITHYATGQEVQAGTAVLADMNGDGRLDLVTLRFHSDEGGNGILVYPGGAGAAFGAPMITNSIEVDDGPAPGDRRAHNALQLVVGDVNGDGRPDVVVGYAYQRFTNALSTAVGVFLGNGDGFFQAGAFYFTGRVPSAVCLADFDQDGHLDIAAGHLEALDFTNVVTILHGSVNGTFSNPQNLNVSSGLPGSDPGSYSPVYAISAADLNGDRVPDLVLAHQVTGGNPGLLTLPNFFSGGSYGNFISLGRPSYPLAPNPVFIATGDLDGDGHEDVVVPCSGNGQAYVFLADGAGGLKHTLVQPPLNNPNDGVLADVNGDTFPDVVICGSADDTLNYDSFVSIRFGNGDGSFQLPVSYVVGTIFDTRPFRVAAGDLDGDGRVDLVALNSDNTITILHQQSDGDFTVLPRMTIGRDASSTCNEITVTHLNADTLPDLIITFSGNVAGMQVLLNASVVGTIDLTGAGSQIYDTAVSPGRAVTGVLTSSGFVDIVCQSGGNNPNRVFLNDGTGVFTIPATQPDVHRPVALADFNGDGELDIAACDDGHHFVRVIFGNGDGTFNEGAPVIIDTLSAGTTNVSDIAAPDVDGDGKADIVVSGASGAAVIYGDGAGAFGLAVQYGPGPAPGNAPHHITTADVDRDGRLDVGIHGYSCGGLNIFFGRR